VLFRSSSYIDILTGVKDTIGKTTEAVKELGEEIIKEGKIAADIADQRAKADKLERQLIVDRGEANRKRAELLEQAVDREKFTVEERIGFLEEAGKLEEEITNKEIQAAQIRLQAKQEENALAGFQLRVIDMDKKVANEKAKNAAKTVTHQNKVNDSLLKELDTKEKLFNIEEEEEEPEFETDFLEETAEASRLKTETKIKAIEDEIEREKQLRLQQLAWDEEQAIQKAILDGTYVDQKLALETDFQRQRQEIIADADQKILEKQQALEAAKIDLAVKGIGALMNLTSAFAKDNEKSQRKAFEINKKLQIAQAIMQTYQGANAIFASVCIKSRSCAFSSTTIYSCWNCYSQWIG